MWTTFVTLASLGCLGLPARAAEPSEDSAEDAAAPSETEAIDEPRDAPVRHVTLRFDTRYDNIDGGRQRHRLQNSALLGLTLSTFADVQLVAMAVTGDRYTSRWATWYDLTGGSDVDPMALALRQLYLQRWFGPVRVQAGSLAPVKGDVSTSGLEDLGWIDGARVEVHLDNGLVLEAVGGSLADTGTPDLFVRERRLNYGEVEATWRLPGGVEVEAAGLVLDEAIVTRAEVGWEAPDTWTAPLQLRGEAGVNVRTVAPQLVARVETDVLAWLGDDPRLEERLQLRAHLRYVDPDYGRLGELSEDFYQLGGDATLRLDGRIDRQGVLLWNTRFIAPLTAGNAPRIDAGLTWRLDTRTWRRE